MGIGGFSAAMFASTLACLVTIIGIFVIKRYEKWGIANVAYFMSFAAGVLVSVSFIHIVPKSFEMNSSAPTFLLVGFMGAFTTFSAFIVEAGQFMQPADWIRAGGSIILQNGLGFVALFVGIGLGRVL